MEPIQTPLATLVKQREVMRRPGIHGVLELWRRLVARHFQEASNRCFEVKGVVVVVGLDVDDVDTD